MSTEDGALRGPIALIEYVGANEAEDGAFAAEKWAEADNLVRQYIGGAQVPAEVLHGAVLEVGSKLWGRRAASGSEAQFDTLTAGPVLPARDPLVTVYATLNRYLPGAFA